MRRSTVARSVLVMGAIAWFLYTAGDIIADLKDWHGATSTEVVAGLMKAAARALFFALTGNVFKTPAMLDRMLHGASDEQAIDASRFMKT